jgi:hypothetical protein
MTMFASAATPEREDQARDARQRQRDRDELDQREEVERVDAQRGHRDDAEDPVEDQQEQRDDHEAADAREQALVERLLAERRGDLRLADQLELDRQGAGLEQVRELLGGVEREAALDLRAGRRVDAVRVLDEVDERDGDELVVEDDREVLGDLLGRGAGQLLRLAALGDLPGRLAPDAPAALGELEGDDRLPLPPAPWSKFCSGFLTSVPRSATLSARTNHSSLCWFSGTSSGCSAWTRTVPCLTSRISCPRAGGRAARRGPPAAPRASPRGRRRPPRRAPGRRRRALRGCCSRRGPRALGGALDRLELRDAADLARLAAAGDRRVLGSARPSGPMTFGSQS